MENIIKKIYESGTVIDYEGKKHTLQAEIDPKEGQFLFNIIQENYNITKTLEIGFAYGLSSLHICQAIKDRDSASHTIIDPFQRDYWHGIGLKHLEDSGYDFFTLIEKKSEFALPQLLEEEEAQFDFIFVDGNHTFDHALMDCFFSSRLLKVGGFLVIDDVSYPSVRRVADYFLTYPCYEEYDSVGGVRERSWKRKGAQAIASRINRKKWKKFLSPASYRKIFDDKHTRMIALKKINEDTRAWDWHDDFF